MINGYTSCAAVTQPSDASMARHATVALSKTIRRRPTPAAYPVSKQLFFGPENSELREMISRGELTGLAHER